MAGLQRSVVSFRRQGSSGLVWDDEKIFSGELTHHPDNHYFFSGELARPNRGQNLGSSARLHHPRVKHDEEFSHLRPIKTERSNAGRGVQDDQLLPADPPSPKVSAFGCCGGFGTSPRKGMKPRMVR
ncbi:hypothetical protein Droror1_Dr00013570 [Drosera rotundifolia]